MANLLGKCACAPVCNLLGLNAEDLYLRIDCDDKLLQSGHDTGTFMLEYNDMISANSSEVMKDLMDQSLGIGALVLSIVRYSVKRRKGTLRTNPLTCLIEHISLPDQEFESCRLEVKTLLISLERSASLCLKAHKQHISLS